MVLNVLNFEDLVIILAVGVLDGLL